MAIFASALFTMELIAGSHPSSIVGTGGDLRGVRSTALRAPVEAQGRRFALQHAVDLVWNPVGRGPCRRGCVQAQQQGRSGESEAETADQIPGICITRSPWAFRG